MDSGSRVIACFTPPHPQQTLHPYDCKDRFRQDEATSLAVVRAIASGITPNLAERRACQLSGWLSAANDTPNIEMAVCGVLYICGVAELEFSFPGNVLLPSPTMIQEGPIEPGCHQNRSLFWKDLPK